ncbi:Gfo/Idh/MocA family protein [Naasia lichenicola]|uniref:Gfo/Idh/MocA family oxidoreductase n=1 Tax=Naasia lichenicola TaxID=2565933 RepID=A0A4S4FMK2_9MICO|nr:Gfo/Idh/MocA family oxidoreductase [Naasia lichenicola]THG31649.1 Gfo/Idh/MocA family oxidoreductase [Naasia lichenicola]
MSALRWGVAGTGGISRQITADFALVAEADVVAVSSRAQATADAFADDFDIPERFDDYSRMLDSDIDAVYIGTPHVTHFGLARQALLRGRHVLCEKPIGLNAAEVRELAAVARSSGVFLMEAMWMKFSPLHRLLKTLVDDGAIGEVRSVRAAFGAPFPKDGSSRWKPGGSTLLDQGIYPVTLGHELLGEPLRIEASGTVREDGVDLRQAYTLHYPDARFLQGASSMEEFLDQSASVSGTEGWITIDSGFWYASQLAVHRFSMPAGETVTEHEAQRQGHGYTPMLRETTQAILRGEVEHPLHTLDATVRVFDTLDEIRRQITAPTTERAAEPSPDRKALT